MAKTRKNSHNGRFGFFFILTNESFTKLKKEPKVHFDFQTVRDTGLFHAFFSSIKQNF